MGAKTFLFSGDSLQPTSPTFYLDAPLTLTATNLQQGEEIRFERITLRAGDPGKVCGCYVEHMRKADVESIEPLRCPTCDEEDEQFVRLDFRNPIAVLNFPLGSLLRAVYVAAEGEDPEAALGTILVWYEDYNGSADLEPHRTGCPEVCCSPDPDSWADTGNSRCDVDADVLMMEQVDNCGTTRWVEDSPLVWTETGLARCNTTLKLVEAQEVNNCGDTRWTADEEAHCGYFATIPLPECGSMFADGQQPPDATAAVEDCEGEILGWLYEEPREGATVAVKAGCEGTCGDEGEVLGYAVDYTACVETAPEVVITKLPRTAVMTFAVQGRKTLQLLWSDGKVTNTKYPAPTSPVAPPAPDVDLSSLINRISALENTVNNNRANEFFITDANGNMTTTPVGNCTGKNIISGDQI